MEYFTAKQAAEFCGVHERTLRGWIAQGKFGPVEGLYFNNRRFAIPLEKLIEVNKKRGRGETLDTVDLRLTKLEAEVLELKQANTKQAQALRQLQMETGQIIRSLSQNNRVTPGITKMVEPDNAPAAITRIESVRPGITPGVKRVEPDTRRVEQKQPIKNIAGNPDDFPPGTLHSLTFARAHNFKDRTLRDQLDDTRNGLECLRIARGNMPGEERWLTIPQQAAVVEFWKNNRKKYEPCPDCGRLH